MSNIYCNPEKFGLTIVDEVDGADSYEFDMIVVWQRTEDERLFWASDSGCSCPSPFENYNDVDSLEPLNRHTYAAFVAALNTNNTPLDERLTMIQKVEELKAHERWS